MQDSELLELAAKAAGIVGVWHERGQCIHVTNCAGMSDTWWRPLDDDGDALRLAVKLGMNLDVSGGRACALARALPGSEEQLGEDNFEAMRRAIVREAAEVGKNI